MEIAVKDEFEELLNQQVDIKYVDAIFTDLCGHIRGKRIPLLEIGKIFKEGIQLPSSAHFLDVAGGVTNTLGLGWIDGDPDQNFFPVKGTFKAVPWDKEIIQTLISMQDDDGIPSDIDPRNMLIKISNFFKKLKLKPVVAFELEFYLVKKERDNDGKPIPAAGESKTQVYSIAELDLFRNLLDEIISNAQSQDIPATAATSEFSQCQYELNLKHTGDLIKAADDAALLRRVIKETSNKHGYDATFMAKPFLDGTGNGMHIHLSLYDENEKNVFSSSKNTGSEIMQNAIAGMQAALHDSLALFIPDRNGFRRLQPNQFVPMNKTWSYNNRSAAFRIPAGSNSSRRVEHRIASANSNPYLVLSAILAAVHYGISKKLTPSYKIKQGNYGGNLEDNDETFPTSLEESIKKFENSKLLKNYFGEEYMKIYASAKRGEELFLQSEFIPKEEYDYYL